MPLNLKIIMHIHFRLIVSSVVLLCTFVFVDSLYSQINVNETFMTDVIDPNIIRGGGASFTAQNGTDPIGSGWLRLTSAQRDQAGFVYINKDLPSTLGVLIDFEYKTWRDVDQLVGQPGGDGFAMFLFDALVPFRIGGFGGSLGYAPNTGNAEGLAGGYIGIGFDEYGNFSNPTQGRVGGPGVQCNAVALRGPTTFDVATSNPYLTGIQLQSNITSNVNSVGYPNLTATRPSSALFYRRVKINIIPIGTLTNPKYSITVRWRTSPNGNDVTLLNYNTNVVPPANLRLGFGASTGGSVNYHEIRNLVVTTPIGFSVLKNVDKSSPKVGEKVTYTVNVLNSTAAIATNLLFTDSLKLNGILTSNNFTLNSITFNNNGNTGNTAVGYTNGAPVTTGFTNPFSTTLTMQPQTSSSFTIVGTIKSDKTLEGSTLLNTAYIDPSQTGIMDKDSTDNVSSAVSNIAITTPDLQIQKTVDKPCADPINGNIYTIIVSNISIFPINSPSPIIVTDTIPTGFKLLKNASGTTWSLTQTGNILKFSKSGVLGAGMSSEPIIITLKPPTGGLTWTNTAYVNTITGEVNKENNKSSIIIAKIPPTPLLNSPVKYNQGDIAKPLSSNKNLIWYNSLGSIGSSTAPTPTTDTPGTTSYYVSQSNGSCESSLAKIDVIISATTPVTACDSYTAFGTNYTTSGLKTITGKNIAGNDSIYLINLIIKHSTSATLNIAACDSYTDTNGIIYTTSQILTKKIPNAVGCDSTITVNLTINKSPRDTINITALNSYSASDGQVYTASGVKTAIIHNAIGCDSIITINLKVNTTSSITETACYTYTAPDGNVYTTSGIKTAIIPNTVGADSIITISLTITKGIEASQTVDLFQGDSYSINGNVYNQAGEYTDLMKSINGCDSVMVTTIKIVDFPNTITPNQDGKNDIFMEGRHVKIYNRNGILLFEGNNGWDGTHDGVPVKQDTYFFVIYIDSKTKEGYITVVR